MSDEKDLDFLRELLRIYPLPRETENIEILSEEFVRVITIAVNALAGKDENKFYETHIRSDNLLDPESPACFGCVTSNISYGLIDPRHAWTLEDWEKAKWKEVGGGK